MIEKHEGERLAAAINALRPDWPTASLLKFIGDRRNHPMTDLAVQLVIVALDPDTKTPARVDQDGPWKRALTPVATVSQSAHVRAMSPDDCDICSRQPEVCAFDDSHEYRRRNAPIEKLFAEKKSDNVHPDGGDAA